MSKYNSYTIGEAEAHLNGMIEAAEICDHQLQTNVANMIRAAVMVRRASGLVPEAVRKPAEASHWSDGYLRSHELLQDGRTAFRVKSALRSFGTKDEFFGASDERILSAPNCGPTVLVILKRLRDELLG